MCSSSNVGGCPFCMPKLAAARGTGLSGTAGEATRRQRQVRHAADHLDLLCLSRVGATKELAAKLGIQACYTGT